MTIIGPSSNSKALSAANAMPSVNPRDSSALSRRIYVAKPNTGAKAVDEKASSNVLVTSFGYIIKPWILKSGEILTYDSREND
jgi:hypothetical protein